MESLSLNVRVDANDKKSFETFCNSVIDDKCYENLKEAEQEMNETKKRFTKEEVLDSINNITE